MADAIRWATLIVALLAFYLLPWTPIILAAFYFTGRPKLALAAVGITGMVAQPLVVIWWHGPSD